MFAEKQIKKKLHTKMRHTILTKETEPSQQGQLQPSKTTRKKRRQHTGKAQKCSRKARPQQQRTSIALEHTKKLQHTAAHQSLATRGLPIQEKPRDCILFYKDKNQLHTHVPKVLYRCCVLVIGVSVDWRASQYSRCRTCVGGMHFTSQSGLLYQQCQFSCSGRFWAVVRTAS